MILSRHPTHSPLRLKNKLLPALAFRSVVRFGSTTELEDTIARGGRRIELNTTQSIKNSANKLLMKECFSRNKVKTADWFYPIINDNIFPQYTNTIYEINNEGILFIDDTYPGSEHFSPTIMKYPIVTKQIFGSRGRGNTLINNQEELNTWLVGKDLSKYIFEKFYNYSREYRLHVSKDGCFYTNRKMLKADTPENQRWFRNDSNSNWWLETNEGFDKPVNWDSVVEESVKALKAVGLDFGAVDLRIQSAKDNKGRVRENPDFIIVEINSAPSFGDGTLSKYLEEIPRLLISKYESR